MKLSTRPTFIAVFLALTFAAAFAQNAPSTAEPNSARGTVPRFIRFSAIAKDETGEPKTGVLGVTFALYKEEQGGAPLWLETQNVQTDNRGHYTVLLGSSKPEGVPLELFTSAEAQWLGVRVEGQPEQVRVLLVSVPYAIKAHEAETLAGRSISDFVLQSGEKTGSAPAVIPSGSHTGSNPANAAAATSGPTNFSGSNSTQIVGVTQSGTGTGLSATATTHAAVAGTISGPTNTAVFGLASNTAAGSNAAGVTGQSNTQSGPGVQGVTTSAKGVGVQGVVNSTSGGIAVQGLNNATTGFSEGVSGQTSSVTTNSAGVGGSENAATGLVFGVAGVAASKTNSAAGVIGVEQSTSGQVYGVSGSTSSTTNFASGVSGYEGATTGQVSGVGGATPSTTAGAAGVAGYEAATTGAVSGVSGFTASTTAGAAGVNGFEAAASGAVYGVVGGTNSTGTNAAGMNGFEGATTGQVYGVSGGTNSTTTNAAGVNGFEGATTGAVFGVAGSTNSATNFAAGVTGFEGATSGQVFGVSGGTNSATNFAAGVQGFAHASSGTVYGVAGYSNSTTGVASLGQANATSGTPTGVLGSTVSSNGIGVFGLSPVASGGKGVQGQTESTSGGVAGMFVAHGGAGLILDGLSGSAFTSEFSVDAAGNGFYAGNLNVKGKLTKGSGSFKIDHPLDPANKYLSHSFVESPDMMNVYNGNVTTDKRGLATVVLPDYFEALNQDFRYQLTVIGGKFAQAIVVQEINSNRFTIKTSKPSVKVSWQVTGIRHDVYANAYRIPVEEQKTSQEQGRYLHPELFGASPELAIGATSTTPANDTGPALRASLVGSR